MALKKLPGFGRLLLLGVIGAFCMVFSLHPVTMAAESSQPTVKQEQSTDKKVKKSKKELMQEFEQAFQAMLKDPSSLELTFKYAALAEKVQDYEAAITALERILMFNPTLNETKLKLGIYYYRLDSYEFSESYLLDAKEGKDVPDKIIQTADKFLKKIQEKVDTGEIDS